MNITEVRIQTVTSRDKLLAFATVTIDNTIAIHDIRIIDRGDAGLFVAMPSRKLFDYCPRCSGKNNVLARYCNMCSLALDANRAQRDDTGRVQVYADIVHPVNRAGRERLQAAVLEAYRAETSTPSV